MDNITVSAVALPFTLADAASALRVAAGLEAVFGSDFARLNVETSAPSSDAIDTLDALHITRKAAGLDP